MKTKLFVSAPSQIETECLVSVVLDRGESEKTEAYIGSADKAVQEAAADVILSGEMSAKNLDTTLIHQPKLKAKRLLLIGGGKAGTFSLSDLRKAAGTAVRYLKSRGIRSFAFAVPESLDAKSAVKAIVEGAFVGSFDPDTYKSNRKEQKIDELTVIASGDQMVLQGVLDQGRIVGESQNFTRELVNEPSNRMTPTILADRSKKMAQEVGLKCEVYGGEKLRELK